ncbi:MAG: 50S ribosomal protein L5 [Nitrosomonas europaea]|nr:MAG: 50S ribosomal protein L5 [Nitrosomonas europaea]
MARLLEYYRDTVTKELTQKFNYKTVMEVPKITKITLNMGVGEASTDKKIIENAVSDLEKNFGAEACCDQGQEVNCHFQGKARLPRWL